MPDKNGNMIDLLFMITVKSIEGRIVIYAVADDLTEAGMLDIKKALYTEINSMLLEKPASGRVLVRSGRGYTRGVV